MEQAQRGPQWVERFLTIVLYAQAGLAAFVGMASILAMTGFAETDVDGRRLAVGFWAFALMLLAVVIPRFRGARGLLLVPLAWTALHLGDSLYELLVLGDTNYVPRVVIEVAFLAIYLAGYRALARR
jgi:hypothetical protein